MCVLRNLFKMGLQAFFLAKYLLNFISPFSFFCSRDLRWVLMKMYWQYIAEEVLKMASMLN